MHLKLMQPYTLLAPAKINLLLEIVGDRPDGYHELVMVMQSVDLADVVMLKPHRGDRIRVYCDHPNRQQQSCLSGRSAHAATVSWPRQR